MQVGDGDEFDHRIGVELDASRIGLGGIVGLHYGLDKDMRVVRQATLDTAFLANPNRFKNRRPTLPQMPAAVWINPPPPEEKVPTSESHHRTLN